MAARLKKGGKGVGGEGRRGKEAKGRGRLA